MNEPPSKALKLTNPEPTQGLQLNALVFDGRVGVRRG